MKTGYVMNTEGMISACAAVLFLLIGCAETASPTDGIIHDPLPEMDIVQDSDASGDVGSDAPSCGSGGSCPSGQTCCPDNRCYNLTNDATNCGECGKSCYPKGNMCIAGNCSCNGAAPCTQEGYICCPGGGCLDPRFDANNCGDCGVACGEDEQCVNGICGGSCDGTSCPDIPHGTAECIDGICIITECEDGWADGDGNLTNGCECEVSADDNGAPLCDSAYDLGELHDSEPGESVTVEGFCSEIAPVDWYRFQAVDDADTNCDNFHVDVRFLSNPGRAYVFDIIQASCTTGSVVCENDTEYQMAVDTRQGSGESAWGECPCSADPDPTANLCMDNSSPFFVSVKLAEGAEPLGCEPYRIEISNGKYDYTP
jgi:hypothetical protein